MCHTSLAFNVPGCFILRNTLDRLSISLQLPGPGATLPKTHREGRPVPTMLKFSWVGRVDAVDPLSRDTPSISRTEGDLPDLPCLPNLPTLGPSDLLLQFSDCLVF